METVEIPLPRWAESLDRFTLTHEGRLISVDVMSQEFGAQPEIRDLPLLGVTSETHERGPLIAIAAARSPSQHVTHFVREPTHLWIERTNEGADTALEIESADQTKTIVRLMHDVQPTIVSSA